VVIGARGFFDGCVGVRRPHLLGKFDGFPSG